MGSQSSKLVTEVQKHEHAINYMNSGGSMSDKSAKSIKEIETPSQQQELVNTSFKWNFGGQKVFVTGTFSAWKTSYQLQRDKGGEFSIVVPLPKGIYHYKFIVDGDWRFSPDDPTTADEQGNINNVIDTTKIENKAKELMESSTQLKTEKIKDDMLQQKQMAQDFNFSEKAPAVPPHLLKYYYLEEKQKKLNNLWNKDQKPPQGMEVEGQQIQQTQQEVFDQLIQLFSNVNSLSPPQHVNLNHLASLNTGANKNNAYNVYALTHRFKAKYTTIKFYTHKYQDNKQQLFVV